MQTILKDSSETATGSSRTSRQGYSSRESRLFSLPLQGRCSRAAPSGRWRVPGPYYGQRGLLGMFPNLSCGACENQGPQDRPPSSRIPLKEGDPLISEAPPIGKDSRRASCARRAWTAAEFAILVFPIFVALTCALCTYAKPGLLCLLMSPLKCVWRSFRSLSI